MSAELEIDRLLERMAGYADRVALIDGDISWSYADLLKQIESMRLPEDVEARWSFHGVLVEGDFDLHGVSAFLYEARQRKIVVPLYRDSHEDWSERVHIAELDTREPRSPLLQALIRAERPGLVLFSSGSTGQPKAALHDLDRMLEKYRTPRPASVTVATLLFDHIGGINTMLHSLANGGTLVKPAARTPDSICAAIERNGVEVLPASPTFLNMILIGETYTRYDLSSLKLITYGTEAMPTSVLSRLHKVFPQVRFKQTYGLSELGILGSQSRADDSVWVRLGGEGYETQVRDGRLWIRARSSMLGYLNAPSPFDADGWFDTDDRVEQDGEWLRILGRESDLINVGGLKVYPTEVENVLLQLPGVLEAAVYAVQNPITGQAVAAKLRVDEDMVELALGDLAFKRMIRKFCSEKLEAYKVPVQITTTTQPLHGDRLKLIRRSV